MIPPMDAPMPTSSSGEHIIAILGNLTRMTGFMGMKQKRYTLILTDRRIVFAELTKERLADVMDQARNDAAIEGKGLLGKWGAQLKAGSGCHEAYAQMTPDSALAESPGNFAVELAAIQKVKFKAGSIDDQHVSFDQVTIKTASDTYKMNVAGSLSTVQEAFRAVGIA